MENDEEKLPPEARGPIDFTKNISPIYEAEVIVEDNKPRRGRPSKLANSDNGVVGSNPLPKHQTSEPYFDTYNETTGILRGSIIQIDNLTTDINIELDSIKRSKTLKNKYNYITELTQTASNLINAKVSAVREINKIITDAHNLEIRRVKELKIGDEVNDEKRTMDLYSAFINTPIGVHGGVAQLAPPPMDTMLNSSLARIDVGDDMGFNNYMNTATPEQHRMMVENNHNIETVVVYNQETGSKHFDVIDINTGASVPNVSRPGAFILDDTQVNVRNGTARNCNTNQTWKLVVVGSNFGNMNDY